MRTEGTLSWSHAARTARTPGWPSAQVTSAPAASVAKPRRRRSWNDAVADLHKSIGIRPAEEAGVADHFAGLALDEHPDPERLVARSERRLPREEVDQVLLRPVRGQQRAEQLRGVLSIEP